MAFINSIGLANAPFGHLQKDIFNFMLKMYDIPSGDTDKISRLYHGSEIENRFSVLEDFSLPREQWSFFERNNTTSIDKRMKKFFEKAPQLGVEAVQNCLPADQLPSITHLITVSCTGMSAPGLDIEFMKLLNLRTSIHRSCINFMGCYAAIHALKQANAICESDINAKVLIIDVELCTLHFQDDYTMNNIASSLLFGDGAAAAVVSNEKGFYAIEKFYAEVALDGYHDMTWDISSTGFQMTLSAYIPDIIATNIGPLLRNSLSSMGLKKDEIKHWAIHPGGKKIIKEIAKTLSLSTADVDISKKILKDYGNMSSVTILYVLNKMRTQIANPNEMVFAVAFGPGLTIESMFLKSC